MASMIPFPVALTDGAAKVRAIVGAKPGAFGGARASAAQPGRLIRDASRKGARRLSGDGALGGFGSLAQAGEGTAQVRLLSRDPGAPLGGRPLGRREVHFPAPHVDRGSKKAGASVPRSPL